MRQALGAVAALTLLAVILVGPMLLVVSAGFDQPNTSRCLQELGCGGINTENVRG